MSRRLRPIVCGLVLCVTVFGGATSQAAGPTPREIDQSIGRAIRHLASRQEATGAWRAPNGESNAMTALALMSFMAAGHVPGEGPFGNNLERGVRWVLSHQREDGSFGVGHHAMYEHGICTLMLAEVSGMVDAPLAPDVRKGLEKGITLILKAQRVPKAANHAGGWRYTPTSTDSDLSATGWQLLALRAAKDIGCDVPAEAIEYAVTYVRRCSASNRGNAGFTYQPGDAPTPTRTGTGILCLEICGQHHAPETLAGAAYLQRQPLRYHDPFFFYGVYYCMVGMFQVGGDDWEQTRDHLATILLEKQLQSGAWDGHRSSDANLGDVYCTSMAVLALAVEYQYLPIYQR